MPYGSTGSPNPGRWSALTLGTPWEAGSFSVEQLRFQVSYEEVGGRSWVHSFSGVELPRPGHLGGPTLQTL